jgi:tRNA(adenine34) deaminase
VNEGGGGGSDLVRGSRERPRTQEGASFAISRRRQVVDTRTQQRGVFCSFVAFGEVHRAVSGCVIELALLSGNLRRFGPIASVRTHTACRACTMRAAWLRRGCARAVHSGAWVTDVAGMRAAVLQAHAAAHALEVPVGACVVTDGRVVALGHNRGRAARDPTAHAEVVAIRAACAGLGVGRLDGSTLFTTVEPCVMCLGACATAHVARVAWLLPNAKFGALSTGVVCSAHEPQPARVDRVGGDGHSWHQRWMRVGTHVMRLDQLAEPPTGDAAPGWAELHDMRQQCASQLRTFFSR